MFIFDDIEVLREVGGETTPILYGLRADDEGVSQLMSVQRHFLEYMGRMVLAGKVSIAEEGVVVRRAADLVCSAPYIKDLAMYVNDPDILDLGDYTLTQERLNLVLGDTIQCDDTSVHVLCRYVQMRHPKNRAIKVSSIRDCRPMGAEAITLTICVGDDGESVSNVWETLGDRSTLVASQHVRGWSSTMFQDSLRRSISRTNIKLDRRYRHGLAE